MGLGFGRDYYKKINRPNYLKVKTGLLFLNWIVMFGINCETKVLEILPL